MATNDFLPFATSGTANVYTNAEYVADTDHSNGNQPGIAKSKLVNKALRQCSIISTVMAQYIADITGNNSVDDGTTTTLLAGLKNAVSANNTIGTIATLRLTPYTGQQIVSVTGYYTAADNIGVREYYWDAVSIEADNGGTVIQVTGVVTGRWKMKYSGVVDVKWFGAKGDGITDDTAVFQSVFDMVQNGDFSEILISKGQYLCSPTAGFSTCIILASDATDFQADTHKKIVRGVGKESTIIINNDSINATWMCGSIGALGTDFTDSWDFSGINFTSKNTYAGAYLANPYTTMPTYGRVFNVGRIRRSRFDRLSFQFVQPFYHANSGEDSNNTYVQQLTISNCDSVNHQNGFINFEQGYSLDITGNNIESGNGGIKIGLSAGQSSYMVSISNNTIQSNGGAFCGIRMNFGDSISIVNNYFESNRTSAGVASVNIFFSNNTTSSSLILDGNFFAQKVTDIDGYGAEYPHIYLEELDRGQWLRGNTYVGGNACTAYGTSTGTVNSVNEIFSPAGSIYAEGNIVASGAEVTGVKISSGTYYDATTGTNAVSVGNVKFPAIQAPSADVNTLDDYEEGTWTVQLTDQSGHTSATTGTGTYTKIGRLVFATLPLLSNIDTTAMIAGDQLDISLPFNSAVRASGSINIDSFTYPAGRTQVNIQVGASSTKFQIVSTGTGVIDSNLTVASISTGVSDVLSGSIVYSV